MGEIFKHKSGIVKRKLTMDIVKLKDFNLLKKEAEEFGQQSKTLDSENRKLEHLVEILKDPNDFECMIILFSLDVIKIVLFSLNVSKEKIPYYRKLTNHEISKKYLSSTFSLFLCYKRAIFSTCTLRVDFLIC